MSEILNINKTAYLGPNGNFTHMAALADQKERGYPMKALQPFESIGMAFAALNEGVVGYVVAPIENSTDGPVKDTLVALQKYSLQIRGKLAVPIVHFGYFIDGYDVTEIRSKDTAINQCARNLDVMYPGVARVATNSTGLAVKEASTAPGVLGIGSSIAAKAQGLEGLSAVEHLEDNPHNTTVFALLTNQSLPIELSEANETTLIVGLENTKASLLSLLKGIGDKDINISKIKSLPGEDGVVSMLLSVDGFYDEKEARDLMLGTTSRVTEVKYLGSYPKLVLPPLSKSTTADMQYAVTKVKEAGASMDEPDQTFVVFTVPNRPSALMRALEVFRDINLTAIDSLPSGITDEYIFYLGFNNNIADKDLLVRRLRRQTQRLLLVEGGSYHYVAI